MNILVAGLTGSGKTTLTGAIASELGIDRVSGSELRYHGRETRLPNKDYFDSRSFWLLSPEAIEADERRIQEANGDVDELDRRLMALHNSLSHAIFDVWFLPWLVNERTFSIWLDAPLAVRGSRLQMTLDEQSSSPSPLIDMVAAKDERARSYALKRYGVDIFHDRTPFDVVIRSDVFTSAKTISRGVSALVSLALFGQALELTPEEASLMRAASIRCPEELISQLAG